MKNLSWKSDASVGSVSSDNSPGENLLEFLLQSDKKKQYVILKDSKIKKDKDLFKLIKFIYSAKNHPDIELQISYRNKAIILLLTRSLEVEKLISEKDAAGVTSAKRAKIDQQCLLFLKKIGLDFLGEDKPITESLITKYLISYQKLLEYEIENFKKDRAEKHIFALAESQKKNVSIAEVLRLDYGFSKEQLKEIGFVYPKKGKRRAVSEITKKSDIPTARDQELIQAQVIFNHKQFLLNECLTLDLEKNKKTVCLNRYKDDKDSSKYLFDLKYIYDHAVSAHESTLASGAICNLVAKKPQLANQHQWIKKIQKEKKAGETSKKIFARLVSGNPIIKAIARLSRGERMQDLSMLDRNEAILQRFLTKGPTTPNLKSQKRVITSVTYGGSGRERDVQQLSDIGIAQYLCENPGIIDQLVRNSSFNRFYVQSDYIKKYLKLVTSKEDDSLIKGFTENGFPQFYHSTPNKSVFNKIIGSGYIYLPETSEYKENSKTFLGFFSSLLFGEKKSSAYPGVYVSTQQESGYGKYGFAISQPIDNYAMYNSSHGNNKVWLGLAKKIDLAYISFLYQPKCPNYVTGIAKQTVAGREVPVFGFNEVFILRQAVEIARKELRQNMNKANLDNASHYFEVDQRYWIDRCAKPQIFNNRNFELFNSLALESKFKLLSDINKEDLHRALGGFIEEQDLAYNSMLRRQIRINDSQDWSKVGIRQYRLFSCIDELFKFKDIIHQGKVDEAEKHILGNDKMIPVMGMKLIPDSMKRKIINSFVSKGSLSQITKLAKHLIDQENIDLVHQEVTKRKRITIAVCLGKAVMPTLLLTIIPIFLSLSFPPASAVYAGLMIAEFICMGGSVLLAAASIAVFASISETSRKTTEIKKMTASQLEAGFSSISKDNVVNELNKKIGANHSNLFKKAADYVTKEATNESNISANYLNGIFIKYFTQEKKGELTDEQKQAVTRMVRLFCKNQGIANSSLKPHKQ